MFHCNQPWHARKKGETGVSLIETMVALALLGIIGVAFLGALATSSKTRVIADEHVSARILAESQMEDIKQQPYHSSYNATESILVEYPGYSAQIVVDNMRNGGIQKIVITVSHQSKDVHTLESYKVRRSDEVS